jgi:two-component system response regulator NreC
MLVDDHDIVRTGLKSFLETQIDMEVVGEASNGSEAMERSAVLCPDVVLMDITMPGMDGLETTRQMTKKCPNSRVLALTVHDDKRYFFEMLAAGAQGYVTKQAAAEELVTAIRAVAAGNVYLQPALARWLLEDYRILSENKITRQPLHSDDSPINLDVLSRREIQVLELVADGLTTPQIAEQLALSPKTISRHRERIMNKLDLHTNAELVKFAIRSGLINL